MVVRWRRLTVCPPATARAAVPAPCARALRNSGSADRGTREQENPQFFVGSGGGQERVGVADCDIMGLWPSNRPSNGPVRVVWLLSLVGPSAATDLLTATQMSVVNYLHVLFFSFFFYLKTITCIF